jgi:hypothetical protein
MLTKKRVNGSNITGKAFSVKLRVDIEELADAL